VDVNQWLRQYAGRRYGFAGTDNSHDAERAWALLYPAVYQKNNRIPTFAVAGPPALVDDKIEQHSGEKAAQAWMALARAASDPLQLAKTASTNGPLLYDMIDLGRQILAETFDQLSLLFSLEFKSKSGADNSDDDRVAHLVPHLTEGRKSSYQGQPTSVESLTAIGKAMLKLLTDLDSLMGTGVSGAFLLGRYGRLERSFYCTLPCLY
jgi:hypothetical protein